MEHPTFTIGEVLLTGNHAFSLEKKGRIFFSPTLDMMNSHRTLNCGLRLTPNAYKNTKQMISEIACVSPKIGKWTANLLGKKLLCGARLDAAWEQEPREDNRIELSNVKDRFGMPRVNLFWKKSDNDLRTVHKTAMTFGKYLAGENLGRVRLYDWVLGQDDYPEEDELAGFHHMGGTRMALSPTTGIVDKNCKVFDQENLHIAGSSVFPTGGHCNPTLTIVQLAIRLGDHLQKIN